MSRSVNIPEGYKSHLSLRETQNAIKQIKDTFQQALSFALTLDRVTAPLIVPKDSGINDDLNGVERKVEFSIKEIETNAEVVQSLAKWKRMALYRYGYKPGEGIYTDMNAIRRDDNVDNIHSIFVDQWDWESTPSVRSRSAIRRSITRSMKTCSSSRPRSSSTGILISTRRPVRTPSSKSTAPYSSWVSALLFPTASRTTAELRTTMTGP